ncbi:MAG TPA: helix-turn-helix transcriptional regulator [Fastidiosipila sp.]|nr:helix-turn-helix transcriptional regulator [Fastidiosipila sp.]
MNNHSSDEKNRKLADLYKCFADETRIKILRQLFEEGEVSVGLLASSLGMSDSAISHQLRYLRQMRLVSLRKDGKYHHYRLNDNHIHQMILQGLEHIDE